MTTREMTVQEHAESARHFLVQSDREFAAGDHRQGAEKLYGAATQAVIAIAKQRDWGYRTHRATKNATVRLADEYGDPLLETGFGLAEKFHRNFFHNDMEEYERDADRPFVDQFVTRVLEILGDTQ